MGHTLKTSATERGSGRCERRLIFTCKRPKYADTGEEEEEGLKISSFEDVFYVRPAPLSVFLQNIVANTKGAVSSSNPLRNDEFNYIMNTLILSDWVCLADPKLVWHLSILISLESEIFC